MIQPVILAAGKGTRMRSELPKVMHLVHGKPMIDHVLAAFEKTPGFAKPIVVVGYAAGVVKSFVGERAVFAIQQELSGTASALKDALPHVPAEAEGILIVYGDQPFLQPATLTEAAKSFLSNPDTLFLGTVQVPYFEAGYAAFNAFGRVVRDADGSIVSIIEYKNTTAEQKNIKELNAGVYAADIAWLSKAITEVTPDRVTGEYYLTSLVEIALKQKKKINTVEMSTPEAVGFNTPEDIAALTLV